MKESFYDFKAKDILGNEVSMNDFKDKVVLIVNVASACYFTPHEEILNFCTSHFDGSFPMFEKIVVNGANAHPLFKFLKKTVKGFLGSESIKWNFSKFLVDQSGNVIKRYGSMYAPESIEADITKLLAKC